MDSLAECYRVFIMNAGSMIIKYIFGSWLIQHDTGADVSCLQL